MADMGLWISPWKRRKLVFQELVIDFVCKLSGVECHLYGSLRESFAEKQANRYLERANYSHIIAVSLVFVAIWPRPSSQALTLILIL